MDHTYIIGFALIALACVGIVINIAIARHDVRVRRNEQRQAAIAAENARTQNRTWKMLKSL